MKTPKRLGKIVITILFVFLVMSIIAVFVGLASTYFVKLVDTEDGEKIRASLEENVIEDGTEEETEETSILQSTADLLTVDDFSKLLSKENIIAVLVFAIIFGIAVNMTGEKAKPIVDFLSAANEVINNVVKIIMYYAPIGLGCYFASFVGSFGGIYSGRLFKNFCCLYSGRSCFLYCNVYNICIYSRCGKNGVKAFWKNVAPSTLTALATCSSAASIPVNIQCSKKMGVPDDIAETTIPLGTSFHKDGSIIGSVFKIMFLVCLFGTPLSTAGDIAGVIGVALLATLLVTAVPIGGGTISEMLILTMLGYPIAALPILTMIATIIDAPATCTKCFR